MQLGDCHQSSPASAFAIASQRSSSPRFEYSPPRCRERGGVRFLVRAAAPAHPESFARKGEARERRGLSAVAQASEVHLPERGGCDVLEAERQVRSGDGPGALDAPGSKSATSWPV